MIGDTLSGEAAELRRRAADLAGALSRAARRSATIAQERAVLRMLGVDGLDRAGRPLAASLAERYCGSDPRRLARGVILPFVAAMLSIFLLSLIGVPLTGGFFGKFYIFKAALESHLVWLTVLGLLNSAVAAYYYLRLLVMMYFREPGDAASSVEPLTPAFSAALILPAIGTLFLGIFPGWVLDFAGRSASLVK